MLESILYITEVLHYLMVQNKYTIAKVLFVATCNAIVT